MVEGQKLYKALQPITLPGDEPMVQPGETLTLSDEQAAILLPMGVVEISTGTEEVSSGSNNWSS
jgi:hypothetical protein